VRFLSLAFAALLACALRLTYAEIIFRRDTPASVQQAIWLDRAAPPVRYFERLAELDSEHADRWLREALRLNPRLSSAWIELGAESDLLEAARVDHRYLPAWTLANFYFRAGNEQAFWPWARRAADLAYDDLGPLLQLANRLDPDALRVIARLGGSDRVMRAELDSLVAAGRMNAGQQVARVLLERRSLEDQPRLIEMTERQIQAGNAAYAVELWNGLSQRPPTAVGFGWRVPSVEGVTTEWKPDELTLSFSGTQPETCALLERVVAFTKPYRLSFEYQGAAGGIRWDLDGQESGPLTSSGEWHFSPKHSLARLRLIYRRDPGKVPAEGRLELRHIRLEPML
jgi:hypothetical protein